MVDLMMSSVSDLLIHVFQGLCVGKSSMWNVGRGGGGGGGGVEGEGGMKLIKSSLTPLSFALHESGRA